MGRRLYAGALALALVAAACADDSAPGTGAASGGGAGASSAVDDNTFALKYTGGTAGKASGEPYRVGYVSQDDFLPAATVGASAAAAFINNELGGVGGRPLELVKCPVSTPEDAAQCGTKLANDATISLVIVGALNVGNRELY
jgi:branched-chain amino acid transport system substrate-binding protein